MSAAASTVVLEPHLNERPEEVEEPEGFDSDEFIEEHVQFFSNLKEPVRVAFFGTRGSGKSSLITTIANALSSLRQLQKSVAPSRASKECVTKCVKYYQIHEKIILVDTPGFSQDDQKETPFEKILDCVIGDGMSLREFVGYKKKDRYSEGPEAIDAVILVVDCMDVIGDGWEWVNTQLNSLISLLMDRGIVPFIALHKINKLRLKDGDLPHVFRFEAVQDMIARLSSDTGLPVNQILPTKAYHCEWTRKPNVERLALFALKEVVEANVQKLEESTF